MPRPTQIRFAVIASASLMSMLLYLDRFCISFAEMYIQEDLGLTPVQVGWFLSAFFWTYALGQVPSGWLTDRFGSRIMLTIYVLAWSLLTGVTGLVGAFTALLAVRLGFGVAQAGAYPTGSSIVSKWVPLNRRGLSSGVIALGGRIGGFLALFASGYLIVWLTPLSTPARLESGDLLNSARLCYELSTAESPADTSADATAPSDSPSPADIRKVAITRLRARCASRFSAAGKQVVESVSAAYGTALRKERQRLETAGQNPDGANPRIPALTGEQERVLLADLNRLVDATNLFHSAEVQDVSVEREATRLLSVPSATRSGQQVQRMNRLILEGLHRESIKKIYVAGWRPMMFIYGGLGLLVAGLIWWSCRSTPAEHPWCNDAEAELIRGSAAKDDKPRPVSGVPIGGLLTSLSMWCSCLSQWFTNIGWLFLMTWAPRYYTKVHQVSVEELAWLVSIPPLVGWAGMLSGGVVTDLATRTLGLRWGRALPISLSRFLAMSAYLACLFEPSPVVAMVLFSVVAFATDLGTAPSWAFTQDVGGRHVGSVLGWGNMWGNLGAAITPVLLIWIVGDADAWSNAFLTCAGAFALAGVCALGINAAVPIVWHDRAKAG